MLYNIHSYDKKSVHIQLVVVLMHYSDTRSMCRRASYIKSLTTAGVCAMLMASGHTTHFNLHIDWIIPADGLWQIQSRFSWIPWDIGLKVTTSSSLRREWTHHNHTSVILYSNKVYGIDHYMHTYVYINIYIYKNKAWIYVASLSWRKLMAVT
jgi:hypothetical protein